VLYRSNRHVVLGQTTRIIVVAVFGLLVYISYNYISDCTRANILGQSITKTCADLPIVDDTADNPVPGNRVLKKYLGNR
jgi:hypothetical protein